MACSLQLRRARFGFSRKSSCAYPFARGTAATGVSRSGRAFGQRGASLEPALVHRVHGDDVRSLTSTAATVHVFEISNSTS